MTQVSILFNFYSGLHVGGQLLRMHPLAPSTSRKAHNRDLQYLHWNLFFISLEKIYFIQLSHLLPLHQYGTSQSIAVVHRCISSQHSLLWKFFVYDVVVEAWHVTQNFCVHLVPSIPLLWVEATAPSHILLTFTGQNFDLGSPHRPKFKFL